MGLTFENGQLLATTSIAALAPDGQSLRMAPNTEYVLMEIGCSDWDTMDETDLDQHRGRGFLISFEPLLDKYAVLLARGTTRYHGKHGDMAVPLAHHHQHGVVLPLAVSPTGGAFNITVHERAGCSSILAANSSATTSWAKLCHNILETRRVESLSLREAMRLAGRLPIRFLKVDAQGVDLKLFKALEEQAPGLLFSRIGALQMETRTKQCAPLYAGQETCDEALAFMTSLGYRSNHACPKQPRWCERTMKFFRPSEGNFSAARGAIGGHREFYS